MYVQYSMTVTVSLVSSSTTTSSHFKLEYLRYVCFFVFGVYIRVQGLHSDAEILVRVDAPVFV
jgi:hypothetical protein